MRQFECTPEIVPNSAGKLEVLLEYSESGEEIYDHMGENKEVSYQRKEKCTRMCASGKRTSHPVKNMGHPPREYVDLRHGALESEYMV